MLKGKLFTVSIISLCFQPMLHADQVEWKSTANLQDVSMGLIQSADKIVVLYDQNVDPNQDEEKALPTHLVNSLKPSIGSFLKEIENAKSSVLTATAPARKKVCEEAIELFDKDMLNLFKNEVNLDGSMSTEFTYTTVIRSVAVAQYFTLYTIPDCIGQ
jgi:hypothetical protein